MTVTRQESTRRTALLIGTVVVAVVVAGILVWLLTRGEDGVSQASPTPTAGASASEEATASPATESSEPSVSPTEGALLEGFDYTAIVRIEVDDLAVRTGPFTSLPLATAYENGEEIGEARLNAGDYVSIDLGPIQIGDITWYRVFPSDGELMSSPISWDTKNDGPNPIEPGWIATAEGGDEHVSLFAEAQEGEFEGLPLLISGSGAYTSPEFEGFDLYLLNWAYTIDGTDAPCDLEIKLSLADGSDSATLVEDSLNGAFFEDVMPVGAGDRNPILGDDFEALVLEVESDCEWSVRLEAQAHD